MSIAKKNKTRKALKRRPEVVVVTRNIIPASDTLFPEKLKKANEILNKTQFLEDGNESKTAKK